MLVLILSKLKELPAIFPVKLSRPREGILNSLPALNWVAIKFPSYAGSLFSGNCKRIEVAAVPISVAKEPFAIKS